VAAIIPLRCPGAPEWARGAASAGAEAIGVAETGVAETGVAKTGVAETGVAKTGVAKTGMAAIGTAATGTTGAATGTTIMAIMSSLSVTSVSRGGGVGAGVRPGAGAGTEGTHMGTTATVPRTVTVMATAMEAINTATTATVMDTAIMDTAIAAGPEWQNYSAGSLAPVITTVPLTEYWDLRRVEQFVPTSATAAMQADPRSLPIIDQSEGLE